MKRSKLLAMLLVFITFILGRSIALDLATHNIVWLVIFAFAIFYMMIIAD